MKSQKIINEKTKEVYTSKEGVELVENIFEVGDIFIPKNNSIISKKKEITTKEGKKKTIVEYTLIASVKDSKGNIIKINDSEDIFVKLTPTQAKSLQKKLNEDVLINQKVFEVRTYESAEYGEQIGVFLKGKKVEPITWDDVKDEEIENE